MPSSDLVHTNLVDVARLIRDREVSPVDVLDAILDRTAQLNPKFNAYITLVEGSHAAANRAERQLAAGRDIGQLHGVPISVKDLILTVDARTTAGSRIYGQGLRGRRDATVVRRLRRAGAIIMGKTNLHEIALGVTNENEHFGPARNPWNPDRVPGGSSGGSAVAVALGLGYGSVGTDTRGSIRIPAACCGITGIKPTRGLVPTEGVIPLSWTLDNVGPLARSIDDAALLLGVMAGGGRTKRYQTAPNDGPRSLRIGVCDYLIRDLDPEIQAAVEESIALLGRIGLDVAEVSMPELEGTPEASGIITLGEAYAYHEQSLREQPTSFGDSVRQRLARGRDLTAVEFVRAERKRLEVVAAFERVFRTVDCLVGATLPALPPRIGQAVVRVGGVETTALRALPRLTGLANMGGIPAMSLPCGFTTTGLPIGLQFLARRHREDVLFTVGRRFQQETDWHRRRPQG